MLDKTARKYQTRWHALVGQRAQIDCEMALLATEIRREFALGPSGDLQFRRWCRTSLEVSNMRARMLLDAANAVRAGMNQADAWVQLGGWPSVNLIMGLPRGKRSAVYTASLKRADALGHPVSYSTVRAIAASLGATSKRHGRPTRTKSEDNLGIVRRYLEHLYATMTGLPEIPADVQKAMRPTILDRAITVRTAA